MFTLRHDENYLGRHLWIDTLHNTAGEGCVEMMGHSFIDMRAHHSFLQ